MREEQVKEGNEVIAIKLLTLWMIDSEKQCWYSKPCDYIISHGIWETQGVEFTDNGKIYNMICRMPGHNSQKAGDEIKMPEWMLIEFCHQVKIVSQPKLPSIVNYIKKA